MRLIVLIKQIMNRITRKRKFKTERNYIVVTSNSGVRKVIAKKTFDSKFVWNASKTICHQIRK